MKQKQAKEESKAKYDTKGNKSKNTTQKQTKEETKTKMQKWDYIKLECSCAANKMIDKMKRQPVERGTHL